MPTITLGIDLVTVDCCSCGGTFAINRVYEEKRRQDGQNFHCPYCDCQLGWGGQSENAILQRQLAQERQKRDQAEAKARDSELTARLAREEAAKSRRATARLKKRIGNGVCPCCHRTFAVLTRHMAAKHPEYAAACSASPPD